MDICLTKQIFTVYLKKRSGVLEYITCSISAFNSDCCIQYLMCLAYMHSNTLYTQTCPFGICMKYLYTHEDWNHPNHASAFPCVVFMDGLVQDCSFSIANSLDILQSCTKPSMFVIWFYLLIDTEINFFHIQTGLFHIFIHRHIPDTRDLNSFPRNA